jgi:hypothetical protein
LPNKSSGAEHAVYRITLDAAQVIMNKIESGKLDGFLNLSPQICLEDIACEAKMLLEEQGASTEGCNGGRDVKRWLKERIRKTKPVFIALCSAVKINWIESCEIDDRYSEIIVLSLYKDRKISISGIVDSLLDRFTSSEEEKEAIKLKHFLFIKELIDNDSVDPVRIVDLIEIIRADFATNGRQIRLNIEDPSKSYRFTLVEISGLNQNRELSKWVVSYDEPLPFVIETNNWWWKELISIKFKATNGKHSISCSGSIPISQCGFVWAYVSFWLETGEFTIDHSYPLQAYAQA